MEAVIRTSKREWLLDTFRKFQRVKRHTSTRRKDAMRGGNGKVAVAEERAILC